VKDAGPGGYHGKLVGSAKVIAGKIPTASFRTAKVLSLNGKDSYVELPPKLFTNEVVTVEGWVKWRELGIYSRFFQISDAALQLAVMNYGSTPDLTLEQSRAPDFTDLHTILVPEVLTTNQWFHVATVVGANFSRLYLNGELLSTNSVPLDWKPETLPTPKNFLGRSVMKGVRNADADTELNGELAEVRLWAGERTGEQIKQNMFANLGGREPGLLALWNFADVTANDASPNGLNGKLMGQAKVVETTLPSATALLSWSRLMLEITDPTGTPIQNVSVRAEVNGIEVGQATSGF
jgi:hypothetical protein